MSAADYHVATYMNDEYGILVSKQTEVKNELEFGRSSIHYLYNGKLYKSKKKFLEEVKDL